MNEELTGRLEVSLQENEELRSKNLLLEKKPQKKSSSSISVRNDYVKVKGVKD